MELLFSYHLHCIRSQLCINDLTCARKLRGLHANSTSFYTRILSILRPPVHALDLLWMLCTTPAHHSCHRGAAENLMLGKLKFCFREASENIFPNIFYLRWTEPQILNSQIRRNNGHMVVSVIELKGKELNMLLLDNILSAGVCIETNAKFCLYKAN